MLAAIYALSHLEVNVLIIQIESKKKFLSDVDNEHLKTSAKPKKELLGSMQSHKFLN